jgi:hypothetical protein
MIKPVSDEVLPETVHKAVNATNERTNLSAILTINVSALTIDTLEFIFVFGIFGKRFYAHR